MRIRMDPDPTLEKTKTDSNRDQDSIVKKNRIGFITGSGSEKPDPRKPSPDPQPQYPVYADDTTV